MENLWFSWFSSPYEELVYIFNLNANDKTEINYGFSSPYEELVYIYDVFDGYDTPCGYSVFVPLRGISLYILLTVFFAVFFIIVFVPLRGISLYIESTPTEGESGENTEFSSPYEELVYIYMKKNKRMLGQNQFWFSSPYEELVYICIISISE